ncbi:hypothetical protein ACFWBB_07080 [Streptomyces sp. NPDC060000]|uniref:hypothetical protein n=1 Tax=Streptomyces sp. NPDC060000 TaxID=3347031 RepID=UPI0036CD086F
MDAGTVAVVVHGVVPGGLVVPEHEVAGKVFRRRRGDEAGRAEAVAYGRSLGTPVHQLDWDE